MKSTHMVLPKTLALVGSFNGRLSNLSRFVYPIRQVSPLRMISNNSQAGSKKSTLGGVGRRWTEELQNTNEHRYATGLDAITNQMENPRHEEHHLHVYATKHNCHMLLSSPSYYVKNDTRPRRRTMLSVSSGNIGFRKAARGSYDAAFQLGAYVMNKIQSSGLLREIKRMELVLRGHGPGREAIGKILLGIEGTGLRDKIIRVVDATRLKHGGTRSRKPRRLG